MTIAVEVIEPCPFSAQWVVVEVIPRPGIELVLIQNGEDFRRVFRSGLILEHIELERDADSGFRLFWFRVTVFCELSVACQLAGWR